MNVETLKDFRLTDEEWHALMHSGEFQADPNIVDVLVLAGLAFWEDEGSRIEGDWDLTDEGHAACNAIDLIFDWDEFVFVEGAESPSKALAEAATVELPAKPVERPESPSDASESVWADVGRKGAPYTVRAHQGRYTCSCPGFGWRGKCKHIEQVKKENL